ncbi:MULTISPECIES: hypothetical protein [Demequina]|uniref:hypothetical protein n=1 Tax=Demequina TaxID=577469 RepID=UPI0007843E5E|nr:MULTISPECIES: hypothetical protein [Demequina]
MTALALAPLAAHVDPPCRYPARSTARAHARRALQRRLSAILDDKAHAAEAREILDRLNGPTVERISLGESVERDARFTSGPLATLGARARAAALAVA